MADGSPHAAARHVRADPAFLLRQSCSRQNHLVAAARRPGGRGLICEDIWLQRLYPVEIQTFNDYLRHSDRLKTVVAPHVQQLLQAGVSVVTDFPANVPAARAWMRSIFEAAGARHVLHHLDTPEQVCRQQLARRNRELPEGAVALFEEAFQQVNALLRPPGPAEDFTLVLHQRDPVPGLPT